MERAHYQYLIIEQVIISAIFNFILNGAIAYGMFHSLKTIPLWGTQSISGDIIISTFMLTIIISLIVTFVTFKKIQSGSLPPTSWRRASHSILGKLPNNIFLRAIILGLIFMIIFAPVAILIFMVFDITEMRFWPFIVFKGAFSALIAALLAPIVASCALGDASKIYYESMRI